ncbi:MAG: ligand-binding protein [Cryobacterium sp.]|nr:ligand-binding protein [Cryobacterium sp.]
MAWIALVVSGMLEAVWASALSVASKRRGRKKVAPLVTFVLAAGVSFMGLLYAMAELPPGSSYAIWVGIGSALTVAWAMFRREEQVSVGRVLCLVGTVACVIGLKAVS